MIDYNYGVTLSRISPDDLTAMREARNSPGIMAWTRQAEPISRRHHEKWFERQDDDPAISMYRVEHRGAFAGVCGLTSIDYRNGNAEFSLYIIPALHGQGLGQKALKTLLALGFGVHRLEVIWGETFDGNPAAKMFEKIGMKKEGTRRALYYRNGDYIDAHLYSMLRSEFLDRKKVWDDDAGSTPNRIASTDQSTTSFLVQACQAV